MKKCTGFVLMIFLLLSLTVLAQETECESADEINSEVDEIISAYDDSRLSSDGALEALEAIQGLQDSLTELYDKCSSEVMDESSGDVSTTSSDEGLFNVIVNGNVNLRSCADTGCDVVGQADNASLLTVVSEDGDWYEVQTDDGTAFIASWLTTRGPDDVIQVGERYSDIKTGCDIVFDIARGDMDINLILTGDNRNSVVVDLYRPNETNPLRVEGQLDKTFIDTGDPYIHQYYSFGLFWPLGIYQLEMQAGGETSMLAWELKDRGDYNIFVLCD
jgi:hypothetical protein